jgi:signal transduction histidine kinase
MGPTLHVLYAEDNRQDVDLTTSFFTQNVRDISLEIVRTGHECLAHLQRQHFDALLLDHRLPDMDGPELLKELANRQLTVPVVMVTGAGDEELVVKLLRLGAMDYVAKRGTYLETLPDVLRTTVSQHRRLQPRGLRVGPRQRRALYVERSEADIDLTVKHFVESAPHWKVDVARSSRDALLRLPDGQFDLVMTDLRMPDLSALDLLREVKHRDLQIPFIVLTGRGDEAAAVAALKLGAYDYIVKRDGYLTQLPYAADNAVDRFQLQQANARLEAELAQRERLQAALGEQAAALADSARQKDEFLAMLGHELRNPLAPIRTALELMRRSGADDIATQRAHDVMDRQITHMVHLVNDLLDVARITSGRITLSVQTTDMRQVIADAVDSTRPLIDARRQYLEITVPPETLPVRGDVTRLVQVIVNLLDNAAKYTPEEGVIRLDASREGGLVVVSVVDTGVGIPPRLLPRIFDLFTQDERTLDRAQGGLGLGLSLVRRITELHGGTVEAHSAGRGHGSQFIVKLPVHVDTAVTLPPLPQLAARSVRRPLRCLIVEDNADAARMLECALTLQGHDVRLAFDGLNAIDLAKAFKPEAVVLDIGLPRMNGYDVARAIRQTPGLVNVNIIAATGYGQLEDRQRARDAGFDHYLVKPIELDVLLETLAPR